MFRPFLVMYCRQKLSQRCELIVLKTVGEGRRHGIPKGIADHDMAEDLWESSEGHPGMAYLGSGRSTKTQPKPAQRVMSKREVSSNPIKLEDKCGKIPRRKTICAQ